MEDDLERRIADLESQQADFDREPTELAINEQNPFEDPEELRRGISRWVREKWMYVAVVALTVFGAVLPRLSGVFPALDQPAPDWVGPLFLALPLTAVAVYLVVRFLKSRR